MRGEKETEYIMIDRLKIKNNLEEEIKRGMCYFIQNYIDIIGEEEITKLINEILEHMNGEIVMRYLKG